MTELEEARALLLEQLKTLGDEAIDVEKALGRVLAEDVIAHCDIPQAHTASMDGYAVISEDAVQGLNLEVIGTVRAGEIFEGSVGQRRAVRVMTGALMPKGSDAVVPLEDAVMLHDGTIRSPGGLPAWANVARRGTMAKAQDILIPRGEWIGPGQMLTMLNIGLRRTRAGKKPRVGIVATGSELVSAGEPSREGQRVASHGFFLRALVQAAGGDVTVVGPIADDSRQLKKAMASLSNNDLILSTGGTGGGDSDLIDAVMVDLGAKTLFRGISMKPGKSTALYEKRCKPVLALPGGIGGIATGFEFLVRPAVYFLQGARGSGGIRLRAYLDAEIDRDPKYRRFLEADAWVRDGHVHAAPLSKRSGDVGLPSRFGVGWIEVASGRGTISKGRLVTVHIKALEWKHLCENLGRTEGIETG